MVDDQDHPKGEPRVISPERDATPETPEIVKQFPVDTTDKKEVKRVEESKVDQFGKPLK